MPEKMTDDSLLALVTTGINQCVGFLSGDEVSSLREKLMDYYLGEPFGNERDGRSKVVSTDVADVIEGIMPSLMKIFTAGEEVVKFEPVGPEDQAQADQATDYVNYIFTKENPGFLILYTWIKDALLQINGVVKRYWKEEEKVTTETYTGLTMPEVMKLFEDYEPEILGHESYIMTPQGKMSSDDPENAVHDLKIRCKKKVGRVAIDPIPPEYFLITANSRSINDAYIVGDYCWKTRSKLLEEGFTKEELSDIPEGGTANIQTGEEQARFNHENQSAFKYDTTDKTMQPILVTQLTLRVDFDGDGIAELRQVTMVGYGFGTGKIIENKEVDEKPYSSITPIVMPHRWLGRALGELVLDIQLIKSTLQRGILDGLYLSTNPRYKTVKNQVNLDDLLSSVPGGAVEVDNLASLDVLPTEPTPQSAFQFLEYEDSVREVRTGVTRYNQGLDANSLNKTATGISRIMDASMDRVELIARIIAETGIIDLFRAILKLTIKHQDKSKVIRLRNEWVEIDPRTWNSEMDVSINVGIGTGGKEAKAQMLLNLLAIQKEAMQIGLVDPSKLYNTLSRYIENIGLKHPETYFINPTANQGQMPQKPDPGAQELELEAKKHSDEMALEGQKLKQEGDLEVLKIHTEADTKIKTKEIEVQGDIISKQHAAEMGSKPSTEVKFDASGKLDEVAAQVGQIALDSAQGNQQAMMMMAQAMQGLTAALQMLSAPKHIQLDNGRTATVAPGV